MEHNLTEILDKLSKLDSNIQQNIANKAMRKGANVIKDAGVEKAKQFDDPKTPEKIWKSIKTKKRSRSTARKNGGDLMYTVDVENHIAYFLEFGTSKMAARPFMRDSLNENADKVINTIAEELKKGIEEHV